MVPTLTSYWKYLNSRYGGETMEPSTDRNKSICVPFESEAHYASCVADPDLFRAHLLAVLARHPELLPKDVAAGFAFHDTYRSAKLELVLRRIKLTLTHEVFLVRPSFLMPYLIGRTEEIERALYLRQWGVPFDALAYVFGRNAMFWYRAYCALGRPSIVGTTIKDASRLPTHLVVDEKHTSLSGEKVYIPTTVAAGCILGASVVASASAEDLTAGYGEFAEEVRARSAEYAPETVCADGWEPTQTAWRYAMRYFHGSLASARLSVRAMALLWNFHPYGARTRRADRRRRSPFHDVNGFAYHENWLHNLLIASSMGGRCH
jgi:hypothetical protein